MKRDISKTFYAEVKQKIKNTLVFLYFFLQVIEEIFVLPYKQNHKAKSCRLLARFS